MRKYYILLMLFMAVLNSALSGDKPSIYITGNHSVDFFGGCKSYALLPGQNNYINLQDGLSQTERPEKSPWLAGLLSAAVPGAGEFYSGSYIKAGVFFGVEVATWIISSTYNRKGDRQTVFYKAYANEHYSPIRYAQWLYKYVDQINPTINRDQYHLFNEQYDPNAGPPFSYLNWPQLNAMEYQIGDGFTHRLPVYGEQQYYELIGKYKQFSKGWDDEPDELDHTTPEAEYYFYAHEFNLADKYYNIASSFVAVTVANHILSALDAAWSASRYNKALHAEVSLRMQPSPIGFVPTAQATLQYVF
jgi:hypothetical protein